VAGEAVHVQVHSVAVGVRHASLYGSKHEAVAAGDVDDRGGWVDGARAREVRDHCGDASCARERMPAPEVGGTDPLGDARLDLRDVDRGARPENDVRGLGAVCVGLKARQMGGERLV